MAYSEQHKESVSKTQVHEGGSDVVYDFTCQPCSGDNQTVEAVGFCVDCAELLCDECFRCHLKPTLMRNHKLLNIEDAKKDTNFANYRDVCTEKCSQHRGYIIKYFCYDHDILGCVACMTENHRNCPGVKYIADIAEDNANSEEYIGLIKQLQNVLLRTTFLIKSSTQNKATSKACFDKVLEDMKQIKKSIIDAFENLEEAMKSEAEKMTLECTRKMDNNIAIFDITWYKTEMLTSNLKRMKNDGQYCKLFRSMKMGSRYMKSLEDQLDKVAYDDDVAFFSFQPSKQLEELIKCKDMLGKLDISNAKGTALKVGEINMKTNNDPSVCSIWGIASLPRGRLVAADNKNKKIKLVDVKQAIVVYELHLTCFPRDITVTDEADEVAVTTGLDRKILLFKVRRNVLLKTRQIKTSGPCNGVASAKDNIVVSLSAPERLEIINKQGDVLRKIVSKEISSLELFSV